MIQVSKNIAMFAVFFAKEYYITTFRSGFFMSACELVSQRYKAINSHWITASNVVICSLARMGGDSLSCIYNSNFFQMPKNKEIRANVNNSSGQSTSTHETRVSRSTQRSRKPSQTQAERLSLILFFQDKYPGIRSLKIKDTGRMFIARARAGKRFLHAGAFSLQNLHKAFEYECQIKASC